MPPKFLAEIYVAKDVAYDEGMQKLTFHSPSLICQENQRRFQLVAHGVRSFVHPFVRPISQSIGRSNVFFSEAFDYNFRVENKKSYYEFGKKNGFTYPRTLRMITYFLIL